MCMDTEKSKYLSCPKCGGVKMDFTPAEVRCQGCGTAFPVVEGTVRFFDTHLAIDRSSPKSQGSGTKRAGIDFFLKHARSLGGSSSILEIGSGRGFFKRELSARTEAIYIATDLFQHESVDVVCDLTRESAFKIGSFDRVLMFNVIEHCYEYAALISKAGSLLRPDGLLLITVPFISPVHQLPNDYFRYTIFALSKIARDCGLELVDAELLLNHGMQFRRAGERLIEQIEGSTWRERIARKLASAGIKLATAQRRLIPDWPIGHTVVEIGTDPAGWMTAPRDPIAYHLALRRHSTVNRVMEDKSVN